MASADVSGSRRNSIDARPCPGSVPLPNAAGILPKWFRHTWFTAPIEAANRDGQFAAFLGEIRHRAAAENLTIRMPRGTFTRPSSMINRPSFLARLRRMSVSYFKRFRMEIDLRGQRFLPMFAAARLSAAGLAAGAAGRSCGSEVPQLPPRDRRRRVHVPRRARRLPSADAGDQSQGRFPAGGDVAGGLHERTARSSTAARFRAFARRTSMVRFRTSASRRRIADAAWARR